MAEMAAEHSGFFYKQNPRQTDRIYFIHPPKHFYFKQQNYNEMQQILRALRTVKQFNLVINTNGF